MYRGKFTFGLVVFLLILQHRSLVTAGTPSFLLSPAQDVSSNTLATLSTVTDTLNSGRVGVADTHLIGFTLTTQQVPFDGKIIISFPPEFDLSAVKSVFYSDTDFAHPDPSVDSIIITGQEITVLLDSTGQPAALGARINLLIPAIRNATVAGFYSVTVTIADRQGRILDGPNVSQPFTLSPGPAITLVISPDTDLAVSAGSVIPFQARAQDQFGNPIPASAFTWALLFTPDSIGQLTGSSLLATKTGTGRVEVTSGTLKDTSGLITVTPAEAARFMLTGTPDTVNAGQGWPGQVTVSVFDRFDNRKTDYVGAVYFLGTDVTDSVPYGPTNRYQFLPADNGQKSFLGTQFKFFSAGSHILTVGDDLLTASSAPIQVLAGPLAAFAVQAPVDVAAGQPVPLSLLNANDGFGNALSGQANVNFVLGGSLSPFGKSPVLTPIAYTNGTGSATQILVATEKVVLRVTASGISRQTDTIRVRPGTLDTLLFNLSSPQDIGATFSGTALVRALDICGNTVTDFNAVADSVVIMPDGAGGMANNVLKQPTDFSTGVANLTAKGTTYLGQGGLVRFTAVSQSGKRGRSDFVVMQGLSVDTLRVFPKLVRRGQEIGVEVFLFNSSTVTAQVTAVELLSDRGLIGGLAPAGGYPVSIGFNASARVADTLILPFDFPPGVAYLGVRVRLTYNTTPLTLQLQDLDSLTVAAPANLNYVVASVTPSLLTRGTDVTLSLQLLNSGTFQVLLDTNTRLVLRHQNGDSLATHLAQATPVFGGGIAPAELQFAPVGVPLTFPRGYYRITSLQVEGSENQVAFAQSVPTNDSVLVESVVQTSEFTATPNPFSPHGGPVQFEYVLAQPSAVRLRIFSLLGDLVFEQEYPAGTNGGQLGRNVILWNGTNQDGRFVANGVYVGLLTVEGSGETRKVKVAVAK